MIGATNRPEMLDRALRRPGRFDAELEIGVPTPTARVAMLEQNMRSLSHNVTKEGMKRIAETLHGFVAADIYGLAQAAAMRVMARCAAAALPTLALLGHASMLCVAEAPGRRCLWQAQLQACLLTVEQSHHSSLALQIRCSGRVRRRGCR